MAQAGRSGIGSITRGALALVVVTGATFLLWVFSPPAFREQLVNALVLTPGALTDLHLWKIFTTGLVSIDGLGYLLDVLMLWLFVPTLERWWGTRRFLTFVAATLVVGHLAAALVGLALGWTAAPIFGLGPFIWASIVAFGVLFAKQPVRLFGAVPISGKALAIGSVVLMALMVLIERQWLRGAGSFAAMALAWAMTSGRITPRRWLLLWRRARVQRRLGVIDGGKAPGKRWMN